VQVDPIKPTLKEPGTVRLKLKYEELLSNCGFKFNLRRYSKEAIEEAQAAALALRARREQVGSQYVMLATSSIAFLPLVCRIK
jgi:hypothetical protein